MLSDEFMLFCNLVFEKKIYLRYLQFFITLNEIPLKECAPLLFFFFFFTKLNPFDLRMLCAKFALNRPDGSGEKETV